MFRRRYRYEELATVRIRAGVGHCENPGTIKLQVRSNLIVKCVPRRAVSGPCRITTLNHEIGNYSMKGGSRIQRIEFRASSCRVGPSLCSRCESPEICYRLGCLFFKQTTDDIAHRCVYNGI